MEGGQIERMMEEVGGREDAVDPMKPEICRHACRLVLSVMLEFALNEAEA